MADLVITLSERERSEIEEIAKLESDRIGLVAAVPVEEMARELLRSHLVLIRDCGGILPDTGPKIIARSGKYKRIAGRGGVSLSGGEHGAA